LARILLTMVLKRWLDVEASSSGDERRFFAAEAESLREGTAIGSETGGLGSLIVE